jgi:hypothetical protein
MTSKSRLRKFLTEYDGEFALVNDSDEKILKPEDVDSMTENEALEILYYLSDFIIDEFKRYAAIENIINESQRENDDE